MTLQSRISIHTMPETRLLTKENLNLITESMSVSKLYV